MIVLVVPSRREPGAGQQVYLREQVPEQLIDRIHTGQGCPPAFYLGASLGTPAFVCRRSLMSTRATPEVLTDETAADTLRPGVVTTVAVNSLPSHLCHSPSFHATCTLTRSIIPDNRGERKKVERPSSHPPTRSPWLCPSRPAAAACRTAVDSSLTDHAPFTPGAERCA
jgi:hypothetical protein